MTVGELRRAIVELENKDGTVPTTVADLIELLKSCNPKALVSLEGQGDWCGKVDVENERVLLGSAMSPPKPPHTSDIGNNWGVWNACRGGWLLGPAMTEKAAKTAASEWNERANPGDIYEARQEARAT
jgi:hypothetical protein